MSDKSYFVTFTYFDKKHLRSNIFHHMSVSLLEGTKAADETVEDLQLLNSCGYYSHGISNGAQLSGLENFLRFTANINFRLRGSYGELKREPLTDIDLGFGMNGGPLIEITDEEKNNLEANIETQMKLEKIFFEEADQEAQRLINQLEIQDEKEKEKKFLEKQTLLREKHYNAQLEKYKDADIIDVNMPFTRSLSNQRIKQEKLRAIKRIEPFEFSCSKNARTCKILGIKLLRDSLSKDPSRDILRDKLTMMMKESITAPFPGLTTATAPIPILTPNLTKMIFHSVQKKYQCTTGSLPLPDRKWDEADLRCNLIAYENNTYIDLNGHEKKLMNIDKIQDYIMILENLMLIKRLLNDFCSKNEFQAFIKVVDATINEIVDDPQNIDHVINAYVAGCARLNLNEPNCFDLICKNIFKTNMKLEDLNLKEHIKQHKIKIEDGVSTEINRLKALKDGG